MVLDTANVNGYLTQMENRVIGSNQRELRRFPRIDKRSKRRLRSVLIAGSNMVGQKNSESGFSTMLIELCRLCFKNKITKSQSIELAMMVETSCLWGSEVLKALSHKTIHYSWKIVRKRSKTGMLWDSWYGFYTVIAVSNAHGSIWLLIRWSQVRSLHGPPNIKHLRVFWNLPCPITSDLPHNFSKRWFNNGLINRWDVYSFVVGVTVRHWNGQCFRVHNSPCETLLNKRKGSCINCNDKEVLSQQTNRSVSIVISQNWLITEK